MAEIYLYPPVSVWLKTAWHMLRGHTITRRSEVRMVFTCSCNTLLWITESPR